MKTLNLYPLHIKKGLKNASTQKKRGGGGYEKGKTNLALPGVADMPFILYKKNTHTKKTNKKNVFAQACTRIYMCLNQQNRIKYRVTTSDVHTQTQKWRTVTLRSAISDRCHVPFDSCLHQEKQTKSNLSGNEMHKSPLRFLLWDTKKVSQCLWTP